jgi:hypothetical protein
LQPHFSSCQSHRIFPSAAVEMSIPSLIIVLKCNKYKNYEMNTQQIIDGTKFCCGSLQDSRLQTTSATMDNTFPGCAVRCTGTRGAWSSHHLACCHLFCTKHRNASFPLLDFPRDKEGHVVLVGTRAFSKL